MSGSTAAILYAASTVAVPSPESKRPDDAITTTKAHHRKDGLYENPWPSYISLSSWKLASAGFKGLFKKRTEEQKTDEKKEIISQLPVQKPSFLPTRETAKLRATWLGHACFYAEFPGGLRVLFDPVFEERCSPFSFIGPKRLTPAPCQVSDIPFIDAVVISHSHYDHLSYQTTQEIKKLHPNAHFFVPLGNKQWFNDSGITNVTELDWWDEVDLTLSPANEKNHSVTPPSTPSTTSASSSSSPSIQARISCLPSQHIANRGLFDRGRTLWASWAIRSSSVSQGSANSSPTSDIKAWPSLYFAGDTGYATTPSSGPQNKTPPCPAFASIGEIHGPFNLGLIPIGAYEPVDLFSGVHADPHDAVDIFKDTKCETAIGMHWGTWKLTNEEIWEPKHLLAEALRKKGLPSGVDWNQEGEQSGTVFGVLNLGASREFGFRNPP